MKRTLLIGSPESTWKEWLFRNREDRDILVADPSDSYFGHGGRLVLVRGDRIIEKRFYGGLNPSRAPIRYLEALESILRDCNQSVIVQTSPYRPLPANLEMLRAILSLTRPDEILLDSRLESPVSNWPIGPEVVELEPSLPSSLQAAIRKANWLKLRQSAIEHRLPLASLEFRGSRLGSGKSLSTVEREASSLGSTSHAEVCGSNLFAITDNPIDDRSVALALDMTHTHKAQFASSDQFKDLICAILDVDGIELGMGFVESVDFEEGVALVRVAAVAPAPAKALSLGFLYVDSVGNERGEVRLWDV